MSYLLTIFFTVFLAELGDKTQIATLLFATEDGRRPVLVFLAAAAALVTSTALAVLLGALVDRYLVVLPLKTIAGLGFIAVGLWTLYEGLKPAA